MEKASRKSKKDYVYLTVEDLKNRWDINEIGLKDIIDRYALVPYVQERLDGKIMTVEEYRKKTVSDYDWAGEHVYFDQRIFKLIDVEGVEKAVPDLKTERTWYDKVTDPKSPSQSEVKAGPLDAKERRRLGQLRKEKEKWDESIRATAHAVLFCTDQEKPVTRGQLWDELSQAGYKKLADTTLEKIWKAIPGKYRHVGGRPRKNPQKHS